jgi:hypothetical protein
MKRVAMFFREDQLAGLKRLSERSHLTFAELVRWAVDDALEAVTKDQKALTQRRKAARVRR